MLRSMTGYGEATVEAERFVLAIEIKSVNNRFLKIHARVADEVFFVQNELEELIRKRLARGTVYFTVRCEPTRFEDLYEVDTRVLKKYLETLEHLKRELGSQEEVRIRDLLPLPGVVHSEESLILGSEEVLPAALKAMDEALDKLVAMRESEGSHLEAELRQRIERVASLVEQIRSAVPRAMDEYHDRLVQRVRFLLRDQDTAIAPEDVVREVAIFAERSDITEEIERMQSHIAQFREALLSDQPVGRKLEFLAQEMFREANTMGAKASSSELNQHVVELKAEVDRIKEQVLNIE